VNNFYNRVLNFTNNCTSGVYPVLPPTPAIGGWEGVGEIHSVGSAVMAFSPGDLVIHAAYVSDNYSNYSYIR